MCSKRMFFFLGLIVVTGLLAGCGDYLNGKKKEAQVIELSDTRFKCLGDVPVTVNAFTNGEATDAAIHSSFGCLTDALQYFRQRTKGSYAEAYSDEDLSNFFSHNFLKSQDISPQLVAGLMKIKKALFAGSESIVTKAELDRLILLLKSIEQEAVSLRPHVKVLLGQEKTAMTIPRLQQAIGQLRGSLQSILKQVDLSRSDYSFEDGQNLVAGFGQFARGPQPFTALDHLNDWLPVASSIKGIFFGDPCNLQGLAEWSQALSTVVDLFDIGLRYHYFVENATFGGSRADVKAVLMFGDRILRLVENSKQLRQTNRIPFSQLDELIDRIFALKAGAFPVTAGTVKDLYRRIVIGMLDPIRRGDDRGADALERIHLLSIHRELNIFRLNEAFVEWATQKELPLDHDQIVKTLEQFPASAQAHSLIEDPGEARAALAAWEKFRALLAKPRPIAFTGEGRAWITGDVKSLRWDWQSLTEFNLMHALVRGFMLGYGDDRDPVKAGVSEAAMVRWYADFQRFGIEIRAFDPRSGNSGARSFKEASFFSYSGNGDARIDMDEMFEYVSMLLAGGIGNVNALRDSMKAASCMGSELDVFGLEKIKQDCFERTLRSDFGRVFNNLPGMAAYVAKLDEARWKSFYASLMAASRDSDPARGFVETSDVRTTVMILHYAESLFTTYDADGDNRLTAAELKTASTRFLGFLRTISPVQNETFLRQAFLALVFNGSKPGAMDMASFAVGRGLEWTGISSESLADRGSVLKVFGVLKTELAGASTKAGQKAVATQKATPAAPAK